MLRGVRVPLYIIYTIRVTLCNDNSWTLRPIDMELVPLDIARIDVDKGTISRFCGYSRKFSPQKLGVWRPLVWRKRAIRESFLR